MHDASFMSQALEVKERCVNQTTEHPLTCVQGDAAPIDLCAGGRSTH